MSDSNTKNLVPEFTDEVVVSANVLNGQANLQLAMRRVIHRRGDIVLPTPEIEVLSEEVAVGWLLEMVKAAALQSIRFKNEQGALRSTLKVIQA